MKILKLIYILLLIILIQSCNKKNDIFIINNKNSYWDYKLIADVEINPIHGICFCPDNTCYFYVNDLTDSLKYIRGSFKDVDYFKRSDVYQTWEVKKKENQFAIGGATYSIDLISTNVIRFHDKDNKNYILIKSNYDFPESWRFVID